ncbi:Protein of unknown function (DUF2413) [Geosmithia morbida]|uniref:Maintenance of telomere capping protein 1 n=1 Tax=Geosmithia morbida TaxID=1094350 RepID=A0A9P5D3I5_9HYPO|nr:Protein of unknown function (DUF2413) [Geosmithia morbida]KAF4124982.1 Protein of unknown function (DUF2413) [Geosmithia morbida]
MASKKTKAPTADDNIDDLFSGIGDGTKAKKPSTAVKTNKGPSASKAKGDDPFADLESQLAAQDLSRPHTPRIKDGRRSTATPPAADDKASTLVGRKSTDSARSLKASLTPSATSSEPHESEKKGGAEHTKQAETQQAAGGGWWGGFLSSATATATAAMKQAEAAYKEIQQNEEAQKWAEQVRGIKGLDVGTLRTYGDELRQRAIPTFANILHTLAPPIGSHERLLIHITHDLVGYPSLDPLIHATFARVMSQVEGGDLLVIQRGHESSSRRSADASAGWQDGPWWRQVDSPRELGLIKGLVEGTKLCRAGADAYASEYYAANGGLAEAKLRATEAVSETNPVRTSDLFLSVQAITTDTDKALFAPTASASADKDSSAVQDQSENEELVCFAVFVLDPIHEIEYSTISQSIPARWSRWLDVPAQFTPRTTDDGEGSGDENKQEGDGSSDYPAADELPDEIREIIESGGVDPREWVAEWIEEQLSLAVGVVAQRYVARRMGVGEGGLGRGKKRVEDLINDNAGEAARAGLL